VFTQGLNVPKNAHIPHWMAALVLPRFDLLHPYLREREGETERKREGKRGEEEVGSGTNRERERGKVRERRRERVWVGDRESKSAR